MQCAQAAFDIEDLIRQAELDNAPAWAGAPLGFTTDYWTPDDYAAATERAHLEHGNRIWRDTHMWGNAIAAPPIATVDHRLQVLYAELRCEHHGERCACVGGLTYQANCQPCRWHQITADENGAVEAWHDHAMTGWRELPVMPRKLASALSNHSKQAAAAAAAWIQDNYPAAWVTDASPILTIRTPYGTRHVPGRSPLGGYDICVGTTSTK